MSDVHETRGRVGQDRVLNVICQVCAGASAPNIIAGATEPVARAGADIGNLTGSSGLNTDT